MLSPLALFLLLLAGCEDVISDNSDNNFADTTGTDTTGTDTTITTAATLEGVVLIESDYMTGQFGFGDEEGIYQAGATIDQDAEVVVDDGTVYVLEHTVGNIIKMSDAGQKLKQTVIHLRSKGEINAILRRYFEDI